MTEDSWYYSFLPIAIKRLASGTDGDDDEWW